MSPIKTSTREVEICRVLRETQQRTGISQAALGQAIGQRLSEEWGQSRVWKLLWCQVPITLRVLEAVTDALGIPFEDLVAPRKGAGLFLTEEEQVLIGHLRRTNRLQATIEALGVPDVPLPTVKQRRA